MHIFFDALRKSDYNITRLTLSISTWHMLRYVSTYDDGEGTVLVYSMEGMPTYHSVLFPGIKVPNLLEKLKLKQDFEQYYIIPKKSFSPLKCRRCKGAGKLDWISKATITARGIKDFTQSDREFLGFHHSVNKYPYIASQFIMSRTTIDRENGEDYCDNCKGTGIKINGVYRLFRPFTDIMRCLVLKEY